MIICRAASIWSLPGTVECKRCERFFPALHVIAIIRVTKFCDGDELHDWEAHMLCEHCVAEAVPAIGRV